MVQYIVNSSGVLAALVFFLRFLAEERKRNNEMYGRFSEIIDGHLKESIKAKMDLAEKMQYFSDTERELKDVIHKLYEELVRKSGFLQKERKEKV